MENDDSQPVVLDLGSAVVKAGFAGDDVPRAVFPTVVGAPRYPAVMRDRPDPKERFVGDEAQERRGILTLRYPIENGLVQDWDALEHLLHHTFSTELRVSPEQRPTLISEHPLTPHRTREQLCQYMFEIFDVPAYLPAMAPILAMFGMGRSIGTCVDIGEDVMAIIPVIYGRVFSAGVRRVHLAGRELTNYMTRLMHNRGLYLTSSSNFEIVRTLKENLSYVALDYEHDLQLSLRSSELQRQYELPDGQIITIENERFTCPEALFKPSLLGRESKGVHELVHEAINATDRDNQRDLYGNILLCGGSTMFSGFADRLHKEISALAPVATQKCKIIATPERKYSAWIGGSIIASLEMRRGLSSCWIYKDEYDEVGPNMVHKKLMVK